MGMLISSVAALLRIEKPAREATVMKKEMKLKMAVTEQQQSEHQVADAPRMQPTYSVEIELIWNTETDLWLLLSDGGVGNSEKRFHKQETNRPSFIYVLITVLQQD